MIRPMSPSTNAFLSTLARVNDRMARAQKQIGTGMRVSAVSDDPGAVTAILQAQSSLESVQQTVQNLGRVKSEVGAAEQGLQSAVKFIERARSLGAQAVNSTQTPEGRQAIAEEINPLLANMVEISSTSVEGRYIFAGDADQTPPYIDPANPAGTYAGAAATREAEHPNGSTFAVSRSAKDIFDPDDPNPNTFKALAEMRDALLANDPTAISAALDKVTATGGYMNSQLAYYGSVQNKISDAEDFASKATLQYQAQLSNLRDADVTEAIVEFQQAQTQQQAALLIHAKVPRTSLFDFLG